MFFFRFLLDHGASVSAVNNDGELAIDISESDEMEELLQKEIDRQGVNCDKSRHTGNYQATRIFSSNLAPLVTQSPPDLELVLVENQSCFFLFCRGEDDA